jgi:Cu+-exporting ATPase
LAWAAAANRGSEHPLARAILQAAHERGLDLAATNDFSAVPGQGVRARIDGRTVVVGNAALMHDAGVVDAAGESVTSALERPGADTVIAVAADATLVGIIALRDQVKPTTEAAVAELHSNGVKVVMATGDAVGPAAAVAEQLGIDAFHAGVKPDDKLTIVSALQREGHLVAMAGDGVNDAPALAQADIGIAMGTGSDIAIDSAEVTLVKGDLRGIIAARSLSIATVRNMKQNLVFAFLYNAIGIPIAAGVLYPFTGLLLSPIIAAAAMSLSSVSVVFNALRLRTAKV